MLPPEIRSNLREVREERGWTLLAVEAALAGQKGCSKSRLQRIEVGLVAVDVVTLFHLSTLYHTSPWRLVEYADWPVPQTCTCPCHHTREETR